MTGFIVKLDPLLDYFKMQRNLACGSLDTIVWKLDVLKRSHFSCADGMIMLDRG